MKRLIENRIKLLFENIQKADKEFFNAKEYLKPEDRELVLSITGGDVFTYKISELLDQLLSYTRQSRPDEDASSYKSILQDFYNGLKTYNASVFPIKGLQIDKPSNDIYDQSGAVNKRAIAFQYLQRLPKIIIRNLKHITQVEYEHGYYLENIARELKSIVTILQHAHDSVDEDSYARIVSKTFNSKNILSLEDYNKKIEEMLHIETFDMRNIDLQEVKNKAIGVGAEVIQEGEEFILIAVTEAYELREISCAVHWCVTDEGYFSNHTNVIPEMYMLLQASSQVKNEDRLLLYTESDGMDYDNVELVKQKGMPEMKWYNAVNESTYPFVDIDEESLIERVRNLTAEHIDDYIEMFRDEEEDYEDEELSMVAEVVKRRVYESIKGGLADNKTVKDIADKHGVSVKQIERQIEMGVKVEMEHVDDKKLAKEISMDHLWEIPDYYDRLDKMEKDAEKDLVEANPIMAVDDIPKGTDMKPVHEEWTDDGIHIKELIEQIENFIGGKIRKIKRSSNGFVGEFNNDIIKIGYNSVEARCAQFCLENPNPLIAKYKAVYRMISSNPVEVYITDYTLDINKFYVIVVEKVDTKNIQKEELEILSDKLFDLSFVDVHKDNVGYNSQGVLVAFDLQSNINLSNVKKSIKFDKKTVDESNPIVAIDDIPKGHFERTTNIVSL